MHSAPHCSSASRVNHANACRQSHAPQHHILCNGHSTLYGQNPIPILKREPNTPFQLCSTVAVATKLANACSMIIFPITIAYPKHFTDAIEILHERHNQFHVYCNSSPWAKSHLELLGCVDKFVDA